MKAFSLLNILSAMAGGIAGLLTLAALAVAFVLLFVPLRLARWVLRNDRNEQNHQPTYAAPGDIYPA
jgi:hypothetical protein